MLFAMLTAAANGQEAKQKLFERVFGDAVEFDPAMVAKVKAAKPGERVLVDRNGDGKNDEAWYIDTGYRHTAKVRPLLVRAIDEDGDLDSWKGPDLDSDLYVVDWKADGTVDVVLDYQDNDGDNDIDEMAFYFYMTEHSYFGKDVLRVWWGSDDGDDNLLWYDIDYTYDQSTCQYRCHFSGDESFVAFGLRANDKEWVSAYENPFLFYDPDGDTCSEVVLRIEGQGNQVRAIRYSFDADDDAYGRRTHDYDFSITARAPEDRPVMLPADATISTKLRGIPTQAWLRRDKAQEFVRNAQWDRVLLTWDEMNANTEENVEKDPHERWEGLIAHGNPEFKQVGGPPCSTVNKRYELAINPPAPLSLYLGTDRRMHLTGAREGWLDVDYDFDGKLDARYKWIDDTGDGYFDHMQLDLDGDGRLDIERKLSTGGGGADLYYHDRQWLIQELRATQQFIDAAHEALGNQFSESTGAPVENFFLEKVESWMPSTGLGQHIRSSPAGALFYSRLVSDRLLMDLKRVYGRAGWWARFERLSEKGGCPNAAEELRKQVKNTPALDVRVFQGYTHRIPVRILGAPGENCPVVLRVDELKGHAPDFNWNNCTVVAPDRWLGWRQVPHQVDEAVGLLTRVTSVYRYELTFVASQIPGDNSTYYIYYSPSGKSTTTFPSRTGTAEDWVPPNIGWESERIAYRAYWGQFDFFGKKLDALIYPSIGAKSYHDETDWGIDALNTGSTSGIGGITFYQPVREAKEMRPGEPAQSPQDSPRRAVYRFQNPIGKGNVEFVKRVVASGPVRAVIELTTAGEAAKKAWRGPLVRCIIYAGRQETEIQVSMDQRWQVAPGFTRLAREEAFLDHQRGIFGVWGWQTPVIGDIGMALIADPNSVVAIDETTEERRVVLQPMDLGFRYLQYAVRYWIVGDWRRGRQHPIAPTVENWRREVAALSAELRQGVTVEVGKPEQLRP